MAAQSDSRGKAVAYALIGVGCSAAGLAAVLTNTLNLSVSEGRPQGLGGLAANNSTGLRQQLMNELGPAQGAKPPLSHPELAERLLMMAPLDPTALTYLGLVAAKRGDDVKAQALLSLAVRSEGRSLRARLWLLDHALRKRNYSSAIEHFDRLIRVGPPTMASLIGVMAGIAGDPASRAPLARKLATNPPWRASFLLALNRQGFSPDVIYQLTPQDSAKSQVLLEQSALLQSLLKKKEYERAYLAWINFLPETSLGKVGSVYDPNFEGLPGPLPFNWHVIDGTQGSSELSKTKGMNVSYLGETPATLTEQTLLLSPGRYRLSVRASGSDENNQLSWTVTCLDKTEPIQSMKLSGLAGAVRRYTTEFAVPNADCEAQSLALIGAPTEFPRTASAVLDSVSIEPVN